MAPLIRKLVTLSTVTVAAVERLRERGIDDRRFGGPARSESEALKRLIIIGLEHEEGQSRG